MKRIAPPGVRASLNATRDAQLAAKRCALEGASCDPASFWLQPGIDVVRDRGGKAHALHVW